MLPVLPLFLLATLGSPHTAATPSRPQVSSRSPAVPPQPVDEPQDVEARLQRARKFWRAGDAAAAEQEYRLALAQAPDHADALIGLAVVLNVRGEYAEASALLDRAERLAPGSPDVLAARAQGLRLSGRTSEAEAYYARAAALSPNDPDLRQSFDQIRRINRHRVEGSMYGETLTGGPGGSRAADVTLDLRASDRLRVNGRLQAHARAAQHDARGGGGLEWRMRRNLTFRGSALIGPGADVIARFDTLAEVEHARGRFDSTIGVRHMSFATAAVWIVAPASTVWLDDRTAISLRYYGSLTSFDSGSSAGHHSGAVRLRRRFHPRLWLDASYARGFESFERLSSDRLGVFRADTVAAGALYHLPGLRSIAGSVELQRRRDRRTMVRVMAAVVHRF